MRRLILLLFFIAGCVLARPAVCRAESFSLVDIYDTVSDNDLDSSTRPLLDYDDLIMLLSNYPAYQGTIPDLYINYMRYVLSWSTIDDKYVAFVSYYTLNSSTRVYYTIVLGDIKFQNGRFSGNGVDVYEFFPNIDSYNSYSNYRHSIKSTFSYSPGNQLCFTDITSSYPDLRGQSDKFSFIFLVILAIFISFYVFTKFGFRNAPRRRILK